jgi:GTP-binding protein HflX
MWTHLERQKGNWNVGPGETEIETDRRIVRDRISLLKDKIKALTNKWVHNAVIVGLWFVRFSGIPNVGKSTLMNAIKITSRHFGYQQSEK